MKRTILILLLIALVCTGCANAWKIQSDRYSGDVYFFADGTGIARVDGYPTITFSWEAVDSNGGGEASYLWYHVAFTYDFINDVITSPSFPGAKLVRR